MKKTLIISILALLALSGAVCKALPKEVAERTKPVQLTYWRVFDDSDAFNQAIIEYNKIHPNVNVSYRKLRFDEFEQKLLDALAEDRGPDIFSIHNTWMLGYQSKLLPLPETLTLPYRTVKGSIRKEVTWTLNTKRATTLRQLESKFVDQVSEDVVIDEQIYGLPLSMDTLALYYNKELLNAAGIPEPASDWQTFQEHIKKLTRQDSEGDIVIAGAALGSANNVERSSDILSILMMQNGTKMMDRGRASFDITPVELEGREIPPGMEALIFYTDFASPQKEVYTWNETLPNSLDAFIQGKAAYFFGYSYHLPVINARAPKMLFGIAKLPQIQGNKEINFANYWTEVVSKKTTHPDEAWDFVQFITDTENVAKYLEKTKKPTALRGLIQKQSEDIDLFAFVAQVLTAESWYKGKNASATETALREIITDVLQGTRTLEEALKFGVSKVNQTL
ncbi:ABC transporter substrate-binding protein [Patescibacteria group bacterium]